MPTAPTLGDPPFEPIAEPPAEPSEAALPSATSAPSEDRPRRPSIVPTAGLLNNRAAMAAASVAGLATLAACLPLVVESLGVDGYGTWEALLAVAGVAVVVQTAVKGALLWKMSRAYGEHDPDEARRLVGVGVGVTLLLIVALVGPTWACADRIVARLHVPDVHADAARWLLPALVAVTLLGGVNETLAALVAGYQRAGWAALVQSAGTVVASVAAVVWLRWGGALEGMLFGMTLGLAAMFVALYLQAARLCAGVSLAPRWPSRSDLAGLGPFAGLLLLSNLSILLRDQTDKLVLGSLVSPEATGHFAIAQRATNLVLQVCLVFYAPYTAAITALHARGDRQAIAELSLSVAGWMSSLCGVLCVAICTLRRPLFVAWLGRESPESQAYLPWLLFGGTSAVVLTGVASSYSKAIGRPGLETIYASAALLLNLSLKPVLIAVWGPIGTVAASAISWCCGGLLLLALVRRVAGLPASLYGRTLATYAAIAAASWCGWQAADWLPAVRGRIDAAAQLAMTAPVLFAIFFAWLALLRLAPSARLQPQTT